MTLENYTKRELTLGLVEANLYALVFVIPVTAFFCAPYFFRWRDTFSKEAIDGAMPHSLSTTLIILLSGIVAHELIHGITWAQFCKGRFKSIKFGIAWKALTPYCHCSEPLKVRHYRIGAVMPGIILGFIPSIFAIVTGSLGFLIFGLFFTLAAGGDFLMLWMLRKEDANSLVQDHPSKMGCYLYTSDPSEVLMEEPVE